MGDKVKKERQEISEEKDQHDGHGKPGFDPRRPARRVFRRSRVKDGRNKERDAGQPERGRRDARRGLIKSLLRMAQPTGKKRSAEDEQEVADDRTGDRRFDDAVESLAQRDQADDKLRGIPKSRIEKTANAGTKARSQLFGRATHPAGQRHDRDRGDDEEEGLIPPRRNVSERDRNRHGEQQQIERRKRPTGFSRLRHVS